MASPPPNPESNQGPSSTTAHEKGGEKKQKHRKKSWKRNPPGDSVVTGMGTSGLSNREEHDEVVPVMPVASAPPDLEHLRPKGQAVPALEPADLLLWASSQNNSGIFPASQEMSSAQEGLVPPQPQRSALKKTVGDQNNWRRRRSRRKSTKRDHGVDLNGAQGAVVSESQGSYGKQSIFSETPPVSGSESMPFPKFQPTGQLFLPRAHEPPQRGAQVPQMAPSLSSSRDSSIADLLITLSGQAPALPAGIPVPSTTRKVETVDNATSTVQLSELIQSIASSSRRSTTDKYTQTGDITLLPRRKPQNFDVADPFSIVTGSASPLPAPASGPKFELEEVSGPNDGSGAEDSTLTISESQTASSSQVDNAKRPLRWEDGLTPASKTVIDQNLMSATNAHGKISSGQSRESYDRDNDVHASTTKPADPREIEEFYEEVAEEAFPESEAYDYQPRRRKSWDDPSKASTSNKLYMQSAVPCEDPGNRSGLPPKSKKTSRKFFRRERRGSEELPGPSNPSYSDQITLHLPVPPPKVSGKRSTTSTRKNRLSCRDSQRSRFEKKSRRRPSEEDLSAAYTTDNVYQYEPPRAPPRNREKLSRPQTSSIKHSQGKEYGFSVPSAEQHGPFNYNAAGPSFLSDATLGPPPYHGPPDPFAQIQPYQMLGRPPGCICDGFEYSPGYPFPYAAPAPPEFYSGAGTPNHPIQNIPAQDTNIVRVDAQGSRSTATSAGPLNRPLPKPSPHLRNINIAVMPRQEATANRAGTAAAERGESVKMTYLQYMCTVASTKLPSTSIREAGPLPTVMAPATSKRQAHLGSSKSANAWLPNGRGGNDVVSNSGAEIPAELRDSVRPDAEAVSEAFGLNVLQNEAVGARSQSASIDLGLDPQHLQGRNAPQPKDKKTSPVAETATYTSSSRMQNGDLKPRPPS